MQAFEIYFNVASNHLAQSRGMQKNMVVGDSTLRWPKNVVKNIIFKIVWLSTSTKSILKDVFINYTQNKVVQLTKTMQLSKKLYVSIDIIYD
jgi:hypothetical protein